MRYALNNAAYGTVHSVMPTTKLTQKQVDSDNSYAGLGGEMKFV